MDEHLIEIREYAGSGYQPLVDYGAWRVAILNFLEGVHPDRCDQMERHNETDEVFVLLKGSAILLLGKGEQAVDSIHPQVMESCKLYNVKRHVWHTVIMSKDASILITENCDTTRQNSNYIPLTPDQRKFIEDISRNTYPGLWER
jgi:hypothetical protein